MKPKIGVEQKQVYHGLKSRQIFAQISVQTIPKKIQRKWSTKKRLYLAGRKTVQAPYFAQISPKPTQIYPNLPENNYIKTWPPKKCLSFHFWCHFWKINAHTAISRRFAHTLPKFRHILPGFSPIQDFWGCGGTSCNQWQAHFILKILVNQQCIQVISKWRRLYSTVFNHSASKTGEEVYVNGLKCFFHKFEVNHASYQNSHMTHWNKPTNFWTY